jgi:Zn-dependent peptidase ImmA (M78 family)
MASSSFKRGFKTQAEKISEGLRKELNLSVFKPLDAFSLAEYLRIGIFTVDEIFEDAPHHPYRLKMLNPDDFSAMWLPNYLGEKIIVHNPSHSAYRQQSNLMHELAHVICKHEVPLEQARLCAKLGLHYYNTLQENEAKYLGGCLQIPRPGLMWALNQGYTPEQISEHFHASIDMVNYRTNISGIAKQRAFQSKKKMNV